MAYYGLHNKGNDFLKLDSKTFLSQKIIAMYHTLLEYFNDLKKHDIHCEILPLMENGWLTPRGGLREEGWILAVRNPSGG